MSAGPQMWMQRDERGILITHFVRGEKIRFDPGAVMGPEMIHFPEYPYIYRWNRMERKGQFCRVIARGKMNSCQVEFEDGFQAITSRNALRKRKVERG